MAKYSIPDYPPYIEVPGEPETESTFHARRARERSAENAANAQGIPTLAQVYAEKRVVEQAAQSQLKVEQAAQSQANPGPWLAMLPYNDPLRVEARRRQINGE
jgi:hypothetical protein